MGGKQWLNWLSLIWHVRHVSACTTIGVTKSASESGSTIVSHNNDCSQCDSRAVKIVAKLWPPGAMRPIYGARLEYPREVSRRSSTYEPEEGQVLTEPVGFIPEVGLTYAYWEGLYGVLNEHGLSIGESTCAANFPVNRTGRTALLWIRPLTELAMERCKTARCAVQTMGSLAEEYGFYGEDEGASGAGEALIVGDGEDVWIFEITGDGTGRSAFWAAKRVEEGHVVAIANNFIIREVDCNDSEKFYCSTSLLARAMAVGAWDGKGHRFDWSKAMSPDLRTFSYTPGYIPVPEYTTARLWRIFNWVAPSLDLRRSDNPRVFPFSVRAESKLNARDIMRMKGDHYEGTELDQRVGVFAGPFGNPNRLEGGGLKKIGDLYKQGQFPRSISIPRTSFSTVIESYKSTPAMSKMWWAPDQPSSSVYVPFYATTTTYAAPYCTGNMNKYDERSAWWAFDFVANWMQLNYAAMDVDVQAKKASLEAYIDKKILPLERSAASLAESELVARLEVMQTEVQAHVVSEWRDLGRHLIVKYNDGMNNTDGLPRNIGYPAWWLEMFGVDNDIRPKWGEPSSTPPSLYVGPADVIGFLAARGGSVVASASLLSWASYVGVFVAGWYLGWRRPNRAGSQSNDFDYRVAPIG